MLQFDSIVTPRPFEPAIPNNSANDAIQTTLPRKSLFDPLSQKTTDEYVCCKGIDRGNFGCMLSFASKVMKSTSSVLDVMSRDEKSGFGQNTFHSLEFRKHDVLLPLNGMRVKNYSKHI